MAKKNGTRDGIKEPGAVDHAMRAAAYKRLYDSLLCALDNSKPGFTARYNASMAGIIREFLPRIEAASDEPDFTIYPPGMVLPLPAVRLMLDILEGRDAVDPHGRKTH
jgi:hypothetical protein